jgi:hypothetical protein
MVLCFGYENCGSRGAYFILNGICYQDFHNCKKIEEKNYNVALRHFCATTVAVEEQLVLHS